MSHQGCTNTEFLKIIYILKITEALITAFAITCRNSIFSQPIKDRNNKFETS